MTASIASQRIALVTASSRGIGYACAEALARQGHVVTMCSRERGRIEEAAQQIAKDTGGEIRAYVCDLRDSDSVSNLLQSLKQDWMRIDILVLNSGSPPSGSFFATTGEEWQEGHKLCMGPTVQLTRGVLPEMVAQQWGRILYINSVYGKEPDPGYVISSAERAAQLALMKCLARETADKGVTVNAILPGYIETPLVREYAEMEAVKRDVSAENILVEWAKTIPRKVMGTPSDIGKLVAWIVSESAENITGCALQSDGGITRSV